MRRLMAFFLQFCLMTSEEIGAALKAKFEERGAGATFKVGDSDALTFSGVELLDDHNGEDGVWQYYWIKYEGEFQLPEHQTSVFVFL